MRLIDANITGFGRLRDVKVNLDGKVIAVVGPNEAGKSTLLRALTFLGSDDALGIVERSRSGAKILDSTKVVQVRFVLSDADCSAISHLELERVPAILLASKVAGGGPVRLQTDPLTRKALAPLQRHAAALSRAARLKRLEALVDPESEFAGGSEEPRDIRAELESLAERLTEVASGASEQTVDLKDQAEELGEALVQDPKAAKLRSALDGAVSWLARPDPSTEVHRILWQRSPRFLMFDDKSRMLSSWYPRDEVLSGEISDALANLVHMGGLDLSALGDAVNHGDSAGADTLVRQANRVLSGHFSSAWNQAQLTVELKLDGDQLGVQVVEDGERITAFDERSAGLRMFIALIAFLWARESNNAPILLIDEAENHLHIDAQADLVAMFAKQDRVAKIVYTTHSPACLPADLGAGIRAVIPDPDDQQASRVSASFWTSGPGYSPLMIAMGAAAAAFTKARAVVLAEGASDMILLPSLIKAAVGVDALEYQIAPGLSEVQSDFYPNLETEGALVAYALDDDAGGAEIKSRLLLAGVPAGRIAKLSVPGVENLLEAASYRKTFLGVLAECNPGKRLPNAPTLSSRKDRSWAAEMEEWTRAAGMRPPSKVAVASRLLQDGQAIPSAASRKDLKRLHETLTRALTPVSSRQA